MSIISKHRIEGKKLSRLRATEGLRELFAQTRLSAKDLIMPYFVTGGKHKKEAILSMPGINRLSIDNLIKEIKELKNLGVNTVILFGIPGKKDEKGTQAYSRMGVIQKAVRAIKREVRDVIVITDVCLCAYTSHGHCGIVKMQSAKRSNFKTPLINNAETLKVLAKAALSHAQAGTDFVAPSAMMDGQVRIIREVLDRNGFSNVGILAYSAKYASNFYAPFREAMDSYPKSGERKTYQMDFRNSDEALREIQQDIDEEADIVMVKPALSYLDIIYRAKERFNIPIAAYNVSGEYSLLKIGSQKGVVKEKDIILEVLTSIKRAGADLIISYHAKEVAEWLRRSGKEK